MNKRRIREIPEALLTTIRMYYRNQIWVGLLTGIVIPLATFFILFEIFQLLDKAGWASGSGLSPNFRLRTLSILAIASNLWVLNRYRVQRWELAMRGVVIATALLAILWVVYFGNSMFNT